MAKPYDEPTGLELNGKKIGLSIRAQTFKDQVQQR